MTLKSKWILLVVLAAAVVVIFATMVGGAGAFGSYAPNEPCATCHVNPAGGGALTATGQAFVDGGRIWPIPTTTTTEPATTTTTAGETTTTTAGETTTTTAGETTSTTAGSTTTTAPTTTSTTLPTGVISVTG